MSIDVMFSMRIGLVRPRWTAATIVGVDRARVRAAVAEAGPDARALADRVGHRRAVVVGRAVLEHPEEDEQEDRQDEGELDERLAPLAAPAAARRRAGAGAARSLLGLHAQGRPVGDAPAPAGTDRGDAVVDVADLDADDVEALGDRVVAIVLRVALAADERVRLVDVAGAVEGARPRSSG